MGLGAYLITLREARGVGRKELARRTGLSLSYLHYIENDRTIPGSERLDLVAAALGLDRAERARLVEERQLAELRRLGVTHPEVTVLLNRYANRISDEDYDGLLAHIAELAGD